MCLASGSYDKTIKIRNPKTGELFKTQTGHSNWANIVVIWNYNNLVSASQDWRSR